MGLKVSLEVPSNEEVLNFVKILSSTIEEVDYSVNGGTIRVSIETGKRNTSLGSLTPYRKAILDAAFDVLSSSLEPLTVKEIAEEIYQIRQDYPELADTGKRKEEFIRCVTFAIRQMFATLRQAGKVNYKRTAKGYLYST